MQKPQKYIVVICCAVLLVCALSLLTKGTVGGVEGKFFGNFTVPDTLTIPAPTYTVRYVNNGVDLLVDSDEDPVYPVKVTVGTEYIPADDDRAKKAAEIAEEQMNDLNDGNNYKFSHWMNAGSTKIDVILANNTEDVILYPSFVGVYTATFVDQEGNILGWTTFTTSDDESVTQMAEDLDTYNMIPETDELIFDYWEVHVTNDEGETTKVDKVTENYNFSELGCDITIYPIYTYNGDVNLIPIDNNGDGITDEWQVGGFSGGVGRDLVKIPDKVNGKEVVEIAEGALSAYDDIHAVLIPSTVEKIGPTAFADGVVIKEYPWGGTYETTGTETVTLYYQGTYDMWENVDKAYGWDDNLGVGSRIFFLGENGKVDPSEGYIELCEKKYNADGWLSKWKDTDPYWVRHEHPYPDADQVSSGQHTYNGTLCVDASGDPKYHFSTWTDYDGACDCDDCGGETRPDAEYWTTAS